MDIFTRPYKLTDTLPALTRWVKKKLLEILINYQSDKLADYLSIGLYTQTV